MARTKKKTKTLRGLDLLADPKVKAAYDAMTPAFALARTIIKARTAAGLTQAELAERMGTSQSYIARLESGRAMPTMRTFLRIAAATKTKPRLLLEVA